MISAVITTYKREPYLIDRAVKSVLTQTYKDIEILVIDDSPDEYVFRKKVAAFMDDCIRNNPDINIRYIQHEKNQGACAARNTGLKYAKGEYIAFLDDDDEWLPDKLDKQMDKMLSTDAVLVYCGRICKNDVSGISVVEKRTYYKGNVFKQLLYSNFIGSTSFPLIRTDCLKEIGGFDEQMQSAQDFDVWLRIAKKYNIDYVDEPLVIYHEHNGEQITSNPQKKINGLERLNEKYMSYLNIDPKLWYQRHIYITPYYSMSGNRKKALNVWLNCVCKCPGNIIKNANYLRLIVKGYKKNNNG